MQLIKDKQLRRSLERIGLIDDKGEPTNSGRTLMSQIRDIFDQIDALSEVMGYDFAYNWDHASRRENPWTACKKDKDDKTTLSPHVRGKSKKPTRKNHA